MRPTPQQILANHELVIQALEKAGYPNATERVNGLMGYFVFYVEHYDMLGHEKKAYERLASALADRRKKFPKEVIRQIKNRGESREKLERLDRRFKLIKEVVDKKLSRWPDLDLDPKLSSHVGRQHLRRFYNKRRKKIRHSFVNMSGWFF